MCSLRVVLGWQQLLETDEAAGPLIRHVCDVLEVKTHWDAAELTLYIESPAQGRYAALAPAPGLAGPEWQRAKRIVVAAKACLAGAGSPGAGQGEPDIAVDVAVQRKGTPGVSVSFSWRGWSQNRKLAALLVAEVADAAGLPPLGARVSPTRHPHVCVCITGDPTSPEAESAWCRNVGEAIYRGLAQYWASPVLAALQTGVATGDRPAPVAVAHMAEPVSLRTADTVVVSPFKLEDELMEQPPLAEESPLIHQAGACRAIAGVDEQEPAAEAEAESVSEEEPTIEKRDVWVVEAERVLVLDAVPARGIEVALRKPAAVERPRPARRPRVASVPEAPGSPPPGLTVEPPSVVIPEPISEPKFELASETIVELPPVLIPEVSAEIAPGPAPAAAPAPRGPVPPVTGVRSRIAIFQWHGTDQGRALVVSTSKVTRSTPQISVALFVHKQKPGHTLSRIR